MDIYSIAIVPLCAVPYMRTLAETESEKQIGLELLVDDDVIIGQDFFVRAVVTNRTRSQRDFKLFLNGRATLYTGAPGQTVKFTEDEFTLNGGACKLTVF